MHPFLKDLKSGVRALRRMPGSALISVVVLALGIFPAPVLKLSEAAVDTMVTILQQYQTMR